MAAEATAVPAASQLPVSLGLVALAWVAMGAQEILLFARPTPYGGPYVLHWDRYFWFAALYNLLGLMLMSLPFLAGWLLARSPMPAATVRRRHGWHLGVVMLVAALDHADNEVMRFMGTHLTATLLRTYGRLDAWGADMGRIIATDHGGPYLPFVVLAVAPLLLWWGGRRLIARGIASPPAWSRAPVWGGLLLPLVVPLVVFNLPGGRFRRSRVEPEIITLYFEAWKTAHVGQRPADYDRLVRDYQARWLAESGDTAWRFAADREYPLVRTPKPSDSPDPPDSPDSSDASASLRWNVIYLQLETFRGWNVGHLHPDPRGSATPFLDSLAAGPDGATWTRHLSFGPPTVSGFVAGHCSIAPHGERDITTTYTYTSLVCLPAVLRQAGWRTAYFTGSDPDWDNQTIWLRRWYDEQVFYRDADEDDRVVFRRAAERIRALGRAGAPFFATVISISNHYPFQSREPALDLTDSTAPTEAVRNTMHYTDDVVREFVGGLASEPWFRHTLVVVVGDHGYNLGEHDGTPGQRNAYRESVWVPLIIAGPHPALPRGRHDDIASLLDLAPTVAELLGVGQPVPWQGRSLLHPGPAGRTVSMARPGVVYAENDSFVLVVDAASGMERLFEPAADPLEQRDIAALHPEVVRALRAHAEDQQRLTDYLLEADRVWPAHSAP